MFLFRRILIYDLWEVSWAWPGLMQPISIFITPTSCAYDILDLPRHAKSPLSLLLPLGLILSLCLSLIYSLSLCSYLDAPPPRISSPHLSGLKGHITLTLSVISVSPSICLSVGLRSA